MPGALPGAVPGMAAAPPEMQPFLPTPKDMAVGAVAGYGIAKGLNEMEKRSAIKRGANWLDRQWGIRHFNQALDERVVPGIESQIKKHLSSRFPDAATRFNIALNRATPAEMESLMRRDILHNLEKKFPELKSALEPLRKNTSGVTGLLDELNKPQFREAVLKANQGLTKPYKAGKLAKYLDGTAKYTKGQSQVLERYIQRAKALKGQKIGVGRWINSFMHSIKSIFNAEALKDTFGKGGKAAAEAAGATGLKAKLGKFFSKFAGPGLMGALVIGTPIQQARKAEKGEKIKTFFHNFFGEQLGLFLGWEVSRGLLRGTGLIGKLLGGRSLMRFLKIGSFGGFVAEMLAMFVLAVPFQKVGEKLSHLVFGKPKKVEDPNYKPIDREGFGFIKNAVPAAAATGIAGAPTPQEIAQSFARTEHDKTAQHVLADVNSRWKDRKNIVPIEFMHPGQQH